MQGIVFTGDCGIRLATFPDPTPGPGEVVLEIKASGMCGSDLHMYRSAPAAISSELIRGHEPCGVVVAVGPGTVAPHARVGARVMVHHYTGCAGCAQCNSGWPQMCEEVPVTVYGIDGHGAHAPYMKVRADTLVPLDERLSFIAGAAISCGTGTAWGAFERMGLTGRDTVAVFGQGPVGLSATLIATAQGAKVIAIDVDDERLGIAKVFGADFTVNPTRDDVAEVIREYTSGKGASKVLETSGAASAALDSVRVARAWGTIGLVGLGAEFRLTLSQVLRRQLNIVTSWTMSLQGQRACADFVIENNLELDRLFTKHWRLDQAEEAYRLFNEQSSGKAVFIP
ncbi:alcohol dehydrogenase catalytic domain-containing protein [Rhizobium leguminosarum]|uniref:zinc-dependent alcohol dehydrogenase family protein n=1 Tax=Rhizobium leguminosarum TaxID=384 RepID=UPI001C9781E0|nr:zinc-binding dehydrogenase [Rhizobium leguminosarum]MBY5767542.1 alcohol dehydrogenase catalytic domain-containing protein [Rhizobium leguminosarum]